MYNVILTRNDPTITELKRHENTIENFVRASALLRRQFNLIASTFNNLYNMYNAMYKGHDVVALSLRKPVH